MVDDKQSPKSNVEKWCSLSEHCDTNIALAMCHVDKKMFLIGWATADPRNYRQIQNFGAHFECLQSYRDGLWMRYSALITNSIHVSEST